jgi:hypothetical protein
MLVINPDKKTRGKENGWFGKVMRSVLGFDKSKN